MNGNAVTVEVLSNTLQVERIGEQRRRPVPLRNACKCGAHFRRSKGLPFLRADLENLDDLGRTAPNAYDDDRRCVPSKPGVDADRDHGIASRVTRTGKVHIDRRIDRVGWKELVGAGAKKLRI